jgi:PPP family 3-phenylpropionic acid transporter
MSPSGVPIGACYLALSGAFGLYLPYLSLYLSSVGLSEAQAVQVQAVVPFMSLLVPPLLGLVAEARRARIWLLRSFTAAAMAAFAALDLAGGNRIAITAVLTAFALARAPLMSLVDTTAHDHVRHHGGSYGRLRTWGSLGYLVAAMAGGALYDAVSIRLVVWATTAALGALAVCAWRMPAPPPPRQADPPGEIGRLVRTRSLWLLLLAVAAAQAAATCYDAMLVLHLGHLGYRKDFAGIVIGAGVSVEMLFLAVSGPVLARLRPERAIVAAFAVAALRWLLVSAVTSKAALLAQTPLHAMTFGLYWVSATTLVREYAGPRAAAAGQGLLATAVAVGTMTGTVYGGALLERGGGQLLYRCAAASAAFAAGLAALHAVALGRAGGLAVRSVATDPDRAYK